MKKVEITKEFPEGKENYCPRCYFEDNKVVLRKDCLCKSSQRRKEIAAELGRRGGQSLVRKRGKAYMLKIAIRGGRANLLKLQAKKKKARKLHNYC